MIRLCVALLIATPLVAQQSQSDLAPTRSGIYATWPRLVAAHGLIGISMDNDPERVQAGIAGLFRFLTQQGPSLGVDSDGLGIYAASANVTGAAAYLMSDSAAPGIRAAALYYGQVPLRACGPICRCSSWWRRRTLPAWAARCRPCGSG